MNFLLKKFLFIVQICSLILALAQITTTNDLRNLQNHRNGILNLKDVANHWIGYPKSPYTSFSVTVNPSTTPPTSAPQSVTKSSKKRKWKHQKASSNKRRSDIDDDDNNSDYAESQRSRDKFYQDFEYDYDGPIDSSYGNGPSPYGPSPYIYRSSSSTPETVIANPSISTNSKAIKAILATPKVATYVIPSTKKYVVQRVKSEMVYVPPAIIPPNPGMYAAASNSGMRRLDPLDYDDNGGSSFLNQGPQDSFPPRPVLNKITQPGQRQPCHGPDCHQHHKGLVRFYWRRVVYPRNARGRVRGRGRGRRPRRGRNQRRRPRNRAPSDNKDVYYTGDEDMEESEDDTNAPNNEEEEEAEEDEDNEENDTSRRNVWQPGKAYGHDLNEGTNYDDEDRKVYRDKRYTYRNNRKHRRGSF